MRRADRLLKIVHFLRGRRRAVTAQQIAAECEVCTRTIYRDIETLMATGAPISGAAGVGYMIDAAYYLPPITFTVEELEAIGLGISMVRHWTDDRFAAQALEALTKIQAALPTALQGQLEEITTYSIPSGVPAPALPWRVSFSDLRGAIRQSRKIDITYKDGDAQASSRTLRPLALIFASPVWLLAAWCELRGDFRNFRLDRIERMTLLDTRFAAEPDKSFAAYKAQDGVC
ncbi:YafY family transcriptional regulator [Pseudorhodobacter sp. E13]|uniref:helix-turn-helix transcriptional regulator n=1 Tax=Pseudorhodobacter sp. E13 TaxID=2487931 RepID=UPI000F8E832A|nr:YafY family protein [Pseudorhodobacter sp. E13]RUS60629.1 YafY family transcriptional regulator [Pseudorhodobacter sp. E13]